MKKYSTVLFDLDGTLTDSADGIINSVLYALGKFGMSADPAELRGFLGPPLDYSFSHFIGFSPEQTDAAIKYYREYFAETGLFENEPYEGADRLLRDLKASGKKILLATSKPEAFAKRILERFELAQYFDLICGATMDTSRSRKADVIRYALAESGTTDLSDAIMVGDRHHDVDGARECGLDCIGVLYGYGSREELETAGATYITGTVDELRDMLI